MTRAASAIYFATLLMTASLLYLGSTVTALAADTSTLDSPQELTEEVCCSCAAAEATPVTVDQHSTSSVAGPLVIPPLIILPPQGALRIRIIVHTSANHVIYGERSGRPGSARLMLEARTSVEKWDIRTGWVSANNEWAVAGGNLPVLLCYSPLPLPSQRPHGVGVVHPKFTLLGFSPTRHVTYQVGRLQNLLRREGGDPQVPLQILEGDTSVVTLQAGATANLGRIVNGRVTGPVYGPYPAHIHSRAFRPFRVDVVR